MSRKTQHSFVVVSAITALYVLNVVQASVQWFWINGFFGMAGQPKIIAYAYANEGPIWSYLVTNINATLLAAIADSLLVSVFTVVILFFTNTIYRYGDAITFGTEPLA